MFFICNCLAVGNIHLDVLSKKGKAGSFVGTWLMGFFSALVVSPCVSAPLAGVLLSVSTLGNPLMGAMLYLRLGLGLSTPLMILGASEGRFMPKAGVWLNRVKQLFGVMLLGVAVILLSRLHGSSILVLWAILSVGTGFG
jgi:thiol:disulfide interchange protein DsbD